MKPILLLALLSLSASADLVITEVMPSSAHTTLKGDWWELTNTGTSAVSLDGYYWNDDDGITPSYFPSGISIAPNQSIIILQDASGTEVGTWKIAWGISASTTVLSSFLFPETIVGSQKFSGLGGTGDSVILYNPAGTTVAEVKFGAAVAGRSFVYHEDATPIYNQTSVNGRNGAYTSSQADVGSPGKEKIHFTTTPIRHALGTYSYTLNAARPGFAAPTLTATSIPSFLTLSTSSGGTATLTTNRALTIADATNHYIAITATSAGVSTVHEFVLSILNTSPSVILNEYNAVGATNYLNGGTATVDDDGGAASQDTYFGRALGNGGNWAEFVITGNGSASTMDLRGWKIEIGKNLGNGFVASDTITLSQNVNWQTVPTGTILTIIAKDSSAGGRNTQFGIRNNRSTTGDTWTNLYIGDTTYTTYTNLATNGYTIAAGTVTGLDINNDGTQFRIRNASNQNIYGPVGEGVAPLDGLSSREVFELEGHPTTAVTPLMRSSSTVQGYDDGASESTFGSPNNWLDGTTARTQNFLPFRLTAFITWTASFSLTGNNALAAADPDADGRSNLQEYAFGGDPTVKDANFPNGSLNIGANLSWTHARRNNDAALIFTYQVSTDLNQWTTISPLSQATVAHPTKANFGNTTVQFPKNTATNAKQFFRAIANEP